ncbi:ImmA/IrrE family metallo-endopeptidase [Corynebacterium ulceribovis]|uniref:ImmA/IrrE family metallo-endopeptidase n=1 Tax=Corynebacterium ulceribovis TaxID=487732 RepID=UPI000370A5A2|nr:ImmA/IrrE family metallo-endopeptidase [Corynebacterium ulceribovis]
MIDLDHLAVQLGVTVVEHDGGTKGYYDHSARTISLRRDLLDVPRRCTLAHELGHAVHGDTLTGITHLDRAMERRADRFAANLLIDPAAYRAAEAQCSHPGHIARELGVTLHLLEVWQTMHQRIKEHEYQHS